MEEIVRKAFFIVLVAVAFFGPGAVGVGELLSRPAMREISAVPADLSAAPWRAG